jgi:type VI secretion system protein ImpC
MSPTFSFGKIEITADINRSFSHGVPEPDVPFRIALLGDFSNGGSHDANKLRPKLSGRHPVLIDRDNFDDVLAQFGIELQLPAGVADKGTVRLRIAQLEDFHPDRIFDQVEVFRMLDDLRRRLKNPATFEAAAAEMRALIDNPAGSEMTEQPAPAANPLRLNTGDLLDQIIDDSPGQNPSIKPDEILGDWQGYLRRLSAPHLVPRSHPQAQQLIAHIEAAMGEQMRAILHDPGFQALEATWRAVFFLAHRLDTNNQLQLHLLDISKAELAADLTSSEDLSSAALYRLLVRQSVDAPGGYPWAALAGNYTFDNSSQDAELLGRMAKIAAQAGAPFLAAASPKILGCDSLATTPDPDDWSESTDPQALEAWKAVRQLPEASYLGLALPGFLLRLPYGKQTEPIEGFAFEEVDEIPAHADFLWANPVFACAYLLAEAFSQDGWNMRPGVVREIEGLPLHTYQKDGEPLIKPCTEALLSERAAERLLERGLMPLLSFQGRDVIRLARFQSLASPLKPLAGRWTG